MSKLRQRHVLSTLRVQRGKRSQSEEVSGSSKDRPRRWAKTNLVAEKEEGIPFRRISVGKDDAAWWETPRRAAW